jgi:hypothetical protein
MANLNNTLVVWEFVGTLLLIEGVSRVDSMLVIEGNRAHLLLHVSHILKMILVYRNVVLF